MTVVGTIVRGTDCRNRLLGSHPAIVRLREDIRRAAGIPAPIVIWGPTGSGKEVVARALHEAGPGRDRPFLPINVTALPESLIESELFGAIRGAFTGAADRAGLFEAARGGTVFLDEAGDLTLGTQVKLLRVLETGEVRRVGATVSTAAHFRLVVATQESPQSLRVAGRWREDLYHRLAAIVLAVPPLREHRADIPELVRAFLAGHGLPAIEPAAVALLTRFDWPGNVRELHQVLLRATFFADGSRIREQQVRRALTTSPALSADSTRVLEACTVTGWDVGAAALGLGVSRATLYRRLRALGIQVEHERRRPRPGNPDRVSQSPETA